jgi:hypothetical protein
LETSAKTPQNVDQVNKLNLEPFNLLSFQAFERIVTAVKDRLDSQKADENRVNSQKIDGARWFARMNVSNFTGVLRKCEIEKTFFTKIIEF